MYSAHYMFFTWDIQTTLPDFRQPEFSVVRQHEEFVWLHDRYEEDEEYAGIIVSMDCSMTLPTFVLRE